MNQRYEVPVRDCTAQLLLAMGAENMRLLGVEGDRAVFVPQVILNTSKKVSIAEPEPAKPETAPT